MRVRFVRHRSSRDPLEVVSWQSIVALFDRLAAGEEPWPALPVQGAEAATHDPLGGPWRRAFRWLTSRFPHEVRDALYRFVRIEVEAIRAFGDVLAILWTSFAARVPHGEQGGGKGPAAQPVEAPLGAASEKLGAVAAPGDVLLALGSPWSRPDYENMLKDLCERHRLRFALLLYDIIPLRHPEWCDHALVLAFRSWLVGMLPLAETVFAISRATAADVEAFASERGIRLAGRVQPIPLGTGFGASPPVPREHRAAGLPPAGAYALVVSTIEARKNHVLLFRVWCRLVEDLPRDHVPTLVFAGRVGWMVGDLMQQLVNADWLDGKIRLIESPTDAEVEALYRGCLFTLFPSFAEGWGLPVTESLSFGKPCLVADRPVLREAGGTLARYFDPDNLHDAYRVIRATIEDADRLRAWEARIRREFRPRSWQESAASILAALEPQATGPARPAMKMPEA
jgi:glycosyltransferase involved in cell wall biosynthesis